MDAYFKWTKHPRVLWSNIFLCRKNPQTFTWTQIQSKQKFPHMNTVFPNLEEMFSLLIQLQVPQINQLYGTWWWCSVVSDCLQPVGSSVHGILQARILEWMAISFPGDLLYPGIEPESSGSPVLEGRFFTNWVIREYTHTYARAHAHTHTHTHTHTHPCTDLF